MKKILFILMFVMGPIYADLTVEKIRNMVMKIHEKRKGIKLETLESTREPFVKVEKESNILTFEVPVKEEETKLSLHAILNKKAFINGKWESIDNVVGGYVLKYIGTKGVVLKNKNQIKKLFLGKEREKFITIEEGK